MNWLIVIIIKEANSQNQKHYKLANTKMNMFNNHTINIFAFNQSQDVDIDTTSLSHDNMPSFCKDHITSN